MGFSFQRSPQKLVGRDVTAGYGLLGGPSVPFGKPVHPGRRFAGIEPSLGAGRAQSAKCVGPATQERLTLPAAVYRAPEAEERSS